MAGADGIVTLSVAAGAPAGDQLVEVTHEVLVAPVHVFWPDASMDVSNAKIARI